MAKVTSIQIPNGGQTMVFRLTVAMTCLLSGCVHLPEPRALSFEMNAEFISLPDGMSHIGDSHGDIAVAPGGELYLSVQGGDKPGIQVYGADGHYLHNVPNAPNDLHGFIIVESAAGELHLYGVSLEGQRILKMALDGTVLLEIPAATIPDQFKYLDESWRNFSLTGIAVAPGGDIYVVDGYGRDFIHRFDKHGVYLDTFGGRDEPWNFDYCHQIAVDVRFSPARLICTDRLNNRLIQMELDGSVVSVFGTELRFPSALALFEDELAIAELDGRVTILGMDGSVLTTIGTNENPDQIRTNSVSPNAWQADLFYAPHGIAYNKNGDLFVSEWSKWGRVVHLERQR